jgi:hypothetical protein
MRVSPRHLVVAAPSAFLVFAAVASAQHNAAVSPAAQVELRRVQEAVQRTVGSPTTATANGFTPQRGWFPTMGVHWVSDPRMRAGASGVRLTEPAHLMFSPVAGRDSLVGAAYAYFAPLTDSTRPRTFDGNPPWHDHPNLAPEGHTLAMLHVWFVPSPDGPFAGHNPNIAFWAVGLTPPDPARMRDPATDTRIRKTAGALGTLADTVGLFPNIARREPMRVLLAAMRDSIRPLVPQLAAAQKAGDWKRWDQVADKAAAYWDAIRDGYVKNVAQPQRRAGIEKFLREMESNPASHHH